MGADPHMRDGRIADSISSQEGEVHELAQTLGSLVAHATEQEAHGHARLYETVQGCLSSAEKQLRRAHEIMLNGEAEDFV